MRDKFRTDGKVTYLPGCAPRFELPIQSMAHPKGEPPLDPSERLTKAQAFYDLATQHSLPLISEDRLKQRRTTLEQLEAGENDPALQQDISRQMRDAEMLSCVPPSDRIPFKNISQGAKAFSDGLRVPPDDSVFFDSEQVIVERVYGGPAYGAMADAAGFAEADELDIWAPDHSEALPDHLHIDRHSVFLAAAILIIMLILVALLAALLGPSTFATFSPTP